MSELRRNYTAQLNGWVVKEEPMAVVSGIDTVEGEREGATPDGEAGEEAEPTSGPQEESTDVVFTTKTVILDIIVQHKGGGTLPGITLDITQGDAQQNAKRSWKLWVDTSDLAGAKQMTHTLDGVELDEDDGFTVEVRPSVPEAERSEYPEFTSSAS